MKAAEAARTKTSAPVAEVTNRLVLTEEQTKRIMGISHLEGGLDQLLVVDNLLDYDMKVRRTYRLSFPHINRVSSFLDVAVARGWSTTTTPNILNTLTEFFNLGILTLPANTINDMTLLVNEIKGHSWNINEFVSCATNMRNLGLLRQSTDTIKFLVDTVDWACKKKWEPQKLINHITSHYNELYWYAQYQNNEISFEEFKRKMNPNVK
jgi:hypothetical protein